MKLFLNVYRRYKHMWPFTQFCMLLYQRFIYSLPEKNWGSAGLWLAQVGTYPIIWVASLVATINNVALGAVSMHRGQGSKCQVGSLHTRYVQSVSGITRARAHTPLSVNPAPAVKLVFHPRNQFLREEGSEGAASRGPQIVLLYLIWHEVWFGKHIHNHIIMYIGRDESITCIKL
jgi:hypothetical protein